MAAVYDCSNENVVAELYRKMGKPAAAKAYSVVGRTDLAGELVQEAFIKLWKAKPQFADPKQAYAWIYKTVHRLAIDSVRSAKYRYEISDSDLMEPEDRKVTVGEVTINRDLLVQLCKNLSEREADILYYTAVDQMTQEEIAEMMEVSVRTVQRELQLLKKKLGNHLSAGEATT